MSYGYLLFNLNYKKLEQTTRGKTLQHFTSENLSLKSFFNFFFIVKHIFIKRFWDLRSTASVLFSPSYSFSYTDIYSVWRKSRKQFSLGHKASGWMCKGGREDKQRWQQQCKYFPKLERSEVNSPVQTEYTRAFQSLKLFLKNIFKLMGSVSVC